MLPPNNTAVSVCNIRLLRYMVFVLFFGKTRMPATVPVIAAPRNKRINITNGRYKHIQLIIAPRKEAMRILFCVTGQERKTLTRFHTQSNKTKFKRKKYSI